MRFAAVTLPVTAVLVTRGDVDLEPIVSTLIFDRLIVWNNAAVGVTDMGAYGRYAALDQVETSHVFFLDDDCTVSEEAQAGLVWQAERHPDLMVSNMRENHNAGMPYLALPGYGSVAPVDALRDADALWRAHYPDDHVGSDAFLRVGCDIVIPVLTPSMKIDLGHESFGYAWADNRTHTQHGYTEAKLDYYQRAAALRRRKIG